MAFKWFKKKDKEEENKMTTLEQVRKAYDDLSDEDKKSFHQSLSDRVHESIAAQEREDGNEDSQSAEAREHEALGEEHAEGKGDVAELHESDDTAEEKKEDKSDERKEDGETSSNGGGSDEAIASLRNEIAKLTARVELMERTPRVADDEVSKKLNALDNLYSN